jgi:nucleoside-diphosphate-sugar epimerase
VTLAVVGGTGFIGSSIVAHCRSAGVPVACITAPRIAAGPGPVGDLAASWRRLHGEAFDRLCRALEPFEVVVNAAGVAAPDAADHPSLYGANAVLPAVVAEAAAAAGVGRLVHVSTAAVQGRLDPLDETTRCFALTPYAVSKAAGERALLEGAASSALEVVVYRPTSVQASGRTVTRRIARVAPSLPVVPVAGGDRPLPVALAENVAAGLLCAASMPEPPRLVLQPSEGITIRRLLELFGAPRVLPLPSRPVGAFVHVAARAAARSAKLTAHVRRIELVLMGQGVQAEALLAAGFRPPVGSEGWEELARAERARVADEAPSAPAQ